jgi:hypothetical protein
MKRRKNRAPEKYFPTRRLLNRKQLAIELNATTQVVDNLRRGGAIPSIQFGHFVRFDWDAVLAALEKYTIQERNYYLGATAQQSLSDAAERELMPTAQRGKRTGAGRPRKDAA